MKKLIVAALVSMVALAAYAEDKKPVAKPAEQKPAAESKTVTETKSVSETKTTETPAAEVKPMKKHAKKHAKKVEKKVEEAKPVEAAPAK
jgi:hypothetical protein